LQARALAEALKERPLDAACVLDVSEKLPAIRIVVGSAARAGPDRAAAAIIIATRPARMDSMSIPQCKLNS
jgi:hypothetical protein